MLCVNKNLQTTTKLAKALKVNHNELYRYILNTYPTLMKDVNSTIFMDDEWWDNEYILSDDEELVMVSCKGRGVYITPRGIPLYKSSKINHGIKYIIYKPFKLTKTNNNSSPIVKVQKPNGKFTFTSVGKLVAKHFMVDYDPTKNVSRIDMNGGFDIDNLVQTL